ncbi:MAG: histidine phosphatase family protein [Ruminococcaceae bacterium]|nr:histidine phosphatase family protein [Oscillospiraceae bacterium]
MRKIYLFRHAEPDFGGKQHVCLGCRTDAPLSRYGIEQAEALAKFFPDDKKFCVYSSFMLRAKQTAEAISKGRWDVLELPGIEEQDCGVWDGLSFDEIKERWPKEYASRGEGYELLPPGGEGLQDCAERGLVAISGILDDAEDDIIIVAHSGINRAMISVLLDIPMSRSRSMPQAYVSLNIIEWDGESLKPTHIGLDAAEYFSKESI